MSGLKPVFTVTEGLDLPVTLYANVTGTSFAVVYGMSESTPLSYEQAAKTLGECIMHSLSCVPAGRRLVRPAHKQ